MDNLSSISRSREESDPPFMEYGSIQGANASPVEVIDSEEEESPSDIKGRKGIMYILGEARRSGVFGSVLNLSNTILGAGILALSDAVYSSGLLTGILLLLFFGLMSLATLRILFFAIHHAKENFDIKFESYEEVVVYYFSRPRWFSYTVKKIFELCMFLGTSAPCIVYLQIIGDSIVPVIQYYVSPENYFANRWFIISIISMLIIFPLSLFRKLSPLRYTSFLAIVSLLYLVLMVPTSSIIYMAENGGVNESVLDNLFLNTARFEKAIPIIFMSMPVFAVCFGCQSVSVALYNDLPEPKHWKFDIICVASFVFAGICNFLVGLFGYFHFGSHIQGDILCNYESGMEKDPHDVVLGYIGRACMGVVCMLSYPLMSNIQRATFNSVVFRTQKSGTWTHVLATLLLFFGNYIFAVLIPDITIVFGLFVPLGNVVLQFIVPSAIGIKLLIASKQMDVRIKVVLWLVPLTILGVAFILMILCPTASIFKIIAGDS